MQRNFPSGVTFTNLLQPKWNQTGRCHGVKYCREGRVRTGGERVYAHMCVCVCVNRTWLSCSLADHVNTEGQLD